MANVRDLVVRNVLGMFPTFGFVNNLQTLVESLKPGVWHRVPINASAENAVNVIVDEATKGGWLDELVAKIAENPSNKPELEVIRRFLADAAPTIADPFLEVLLEGNRVFVNRRELRERLRSLCSPMGSSLLLVSGNPQTGKTHSFYLTQHTARRHDFTSSHFEVSTCPQPDELAGAILERIGVSVDLKPKGNESAERWAHKLATQVKVAIEGRGQRFVLVFDSFPPVAAEGTNSFIVRLAKYADEELREFLRVVLIGFGAPLPTALEDVAERDEAEAFTGADMLDGLKQIASSRGWSITEQAIQAEINQLLSNDAPLRKRFLFMKEAIERLRRAKPGGSP